MRLSNVILASLMAASLTGIAQDEKPIGCGKTRPKDHCIKPLKDPVVKNDSVKKPVVKKPERQCGKCGRG